MMLWEISKNVPKLQQFPSEYETAELNFPSGVFKLVSGDPQTRKSLGGK